MQETALQTPAKKLYHEAMNKILSIQKSAMIIQSNNILQKLVIHKKPVDEVTLDFLSAYFTSRVMPIDKNNIGPYLIIETQSCKIIITLKINTDECPF